MATSYEKNPENRGSTKESRIQVMPSSSTNEREGNSERSLTNMYVERKDINIASPPGIAPETLVFRKIGKSSAENLVHWGTAQKSHMHYMGSSNMYEAARNSNVSTRQMLAEYRYMDSSNIYGASRNSLASARKISGECRYSNIYSSGVTDVITEGPLYSSMAGSSDENNTEIRGTALDSQLQNIDYSSGEENKRNCGSPLEEIPVEVTYSNTTPETHMHGTVAMSSDESNPESREPFQDSQLQQIDYNSVDETESGSQSPLEEIPVEVTFSDSAPETPTQRKDLVSDETSQDSQIQSLGSSSRAKTKRKNQISEGSLSSRSTHSNVDSEVATSKQHSTPSESFKEDNSNGQMQQDNSEKTVVSEETLMDASSSKGLEQQKMDANSKPHKCTLCNASFSKAGNLINHIRAHSYEKPHVCEICSASFSKSGNLVNHIKIHNGEKPFKCDLCDESFAEKESLNTHIDTHTGEKPHRCSICNAAFAQVGSLRRHARIHSGEKPHNCTICNVTFSSPGTLRTHIGTHTGEKPFKCKVCGAAFLQSSNLKRHQRIHTGEKPYKCTRCVAAFTDTEHLKSHFRTHTGEKPFKCSQCSAAYPRAGSLKAHMRTHTGERRHICNLCCASFLESSHLKSHLKTHSSEKPHKCTLCLSAFLRHESLKSHMRTHTGERPHKCEFCESAFTTSQHLKIHIRTHTGEKPYACKVCSVAFSRTGTLRRHMRTHGRTESKE